MAEETERERRRRLKRARATREGRKAQQALLAYANIVRDEGNWTPQEQRHLLSKLAIVEREIEEARSAVTVRKR